MIFAGVDPGLSGGIAFLNTRTANLRTFEMPIIEIKMKSGKKKRTIDCSILGSYFAEYNPHRCFVEQVGAMPGQGVTSMFNFGRAVGSIDGVLGALLIQSHFVTPQVWKKHFNLKADKYESLELAREMFRANSDDFIRRKDVDRAEAALIATWGERFHLGPTR